MTQKIHIFCMYILYTLISLYQFSCASKRQFAARLEVHKHGFLRSFVKTAAIQNK